MQHALGVVDLGGAYHRPYRHHSSDGPVVFSTSCHVRQPKSLVSLSLKWVPLSKAQRRSAYDEVSPMDALRGGLREQILYRQVRRATLLLGGSSGRGQPFVDIAIRVAFYFKKFTMRLNFDKQYSTTRWTTLYIFKSLQAAFLIVCFCKNIP